VIFELVTVHKTRLGSAFGVPGATAVLSIKIDLPEDFDFVQADQALDQALGFTATINTDNPRLQLLHRALALGCFVQGMNRIVVSNRYHIIHELIILFVFVIRNQCSKCSSDSSASTNSACACAYTCA
jgi:hypothetical protein